jgi:hypothetical protein
MDNAGVPGALGVAMAMVVVMAALVGTGVWAAVRLEGHMDTPATLAGQSPRRHPGGPPAPRRTGVAHECTGRPGQARNVRCRCRDTARQRAGVR